MFLLYYCDKKMSAEKVESTKRRNSKLCVFDFLRKECLVIFVRIKAKVSTLMGRQWERVFLAEIRGGGRRDKAIRNPLLMF